MLWWHILLCIISIHRIIYIVQAQENDDDGDEDDDEEESTTVPLSTTVNEAEEQLIKRISIPVSNTTINNRMNNGSEQNMNSANLNEPSKQRIIIALAVLCAALAVLLGFLVSIVVCQWLYHDTDSDDSVTGRTKRRPNFVDSPYNYHDHVCRQAIKL